MKKIALVMALVAVGAWAKKDTSVVKKTDTTKTVKKVKKAHKVVKKSDTSKTVKGGK